MNTPHELIDKNLSFVLSEMSAQPDVAQAYPQHTLSYADEMMQIKEYLDSGEYGIAYEAVVACLEARPFVISGRAAVKLLEVGLLLGFKTTRPTDTKFASPHRED